MKKFSLLLTAVLVIAFALFALGSGETEPEVKDQGSASIAAATTTPGAIGKYSVLIDSCRLAKDYEGKPVVIVKYIYTNVSDSDPTSFMIAFDDNVFQNGVGLNEALFVDDSANFSSDNQMKEIKAGATLEVEVAYELNDTVTDIEVEISELISLNNTVITKTFSIAE